jgi:hypothetical protein
MTGIENWPKKNNLTCLKTIWGYIYIYKPISCDLPKNHLRCTQHSRGLGISLSTAPFMGSGDSSIHASKFLRKSSMDVCILDLSLIENRAPTNPLVFHSCSGETLPVEISTIDKSLPFIAWITSNLFNDWPWRWSSAIPDILGKTMP